MPRIADRRWRRFALRGCATLVALALAASAARACNVPVFRYALEHWKPSAYQARVFHRGPLTAAQRALVKKLQSAKSANLTVTTVDLDAGATEEQQALWRLHGGKAALPHVVVRYPEDDEPSPPAFTAPLEESAVAALLDSPARRALVKLLTSGESAVWLLLESGDKHADEEAALLAQRELARLQSAMKLPVQDEADKLESRLPLRLSFALLRVSRGDPAEAAFVRLLLGSDDEPGRAEGPILFPVFGRGRLLCGLRGAGLRPAAIGRWAGFVCGPCSCQVKELNPGVDLLLTAAWEGLLGAGEAEPAPAAARAPAIPAGRVREPRPAAGERRAGRRGWLWAALGACGCAVLFAAVKALRGARPVQTL